MAKIPFNVKFRPQIESGEYKVETFLGYPVTIYRWDFDDGTQTPIMGSYVFEDGKEYVGAWNDGGHFDLMSPNDLDLFIITPEPELTEFEKAVKNMMSPYVKMPDEIHKENAALLLELARKELHDEIEFRGEEYQSGYKGGRTEALKDLPRWKKIGRGHNYSSNTEFIINGRYLEMTDTLNDVFEVALSELEKLPKEYETK